MVGSIISSALGGAMQVGSAIYGQVKSNQLNRKAQEEHVIKISSSGVK